MPYQNLRLSHCAPDELTGIVDSTEMTHRFLPGGVANIETEAVTIGNANFQRGHYDMGVHVIGTWPTGKVCIGMVLESMEPTSINGFLAPRESVQLYGEGVELSYRAPPHSTWFLCFMERDAIQKTTQELCGRELAIPFGGALSMSFSGQTRSRLRTIIAHFFQVARISKDSERDLEKLHALKCQLLFELVIGLDEQRPRQLASSARFAKQRQHFMWQVVTFYNEHRLEPFSLRVFSSALGCSERMLEYQFKQLYGTSPSAWFRSMKMNEINRILRRAANNQLKIGELAMQWGFSHFGRFSKEYLQLFGENPSKTLKSTSNACKPCDERG